MKFRVLKGVLLVGMGVVLGSFVFSKGWAIPDGRNVPSLTYTPIIKVTDARDGQRYRTVEIGTQTWMAENLNYNYNEGTARSYCYDDDPANCEKYGRLYTWSAAMDSAAWFSENGKDCGYGPTCSVSGNVRGVCPEGWHLPSNEEWNTIANYVAANTTGGVDSVGYALKSVSGWKNGGNGSDVVDFNVLPAGFFRSADYDGEFRQILGIAAFWSSTESREYSRSSWNVYAQELTYDKTRLSSDTFSKAHALSVRCVKD